MKVLVAEDDLTSRKALSRVLEKCGYDVMAVCDGLAAWVCMQEPDAPQIALLDWAMPGLDGVELCRRLRAREQAPALYVILVTARHSPEDVVAGLDAGADDFIGKPWNQAELRARVQVGSRMVQLQNRLNDNVLELRTSLLDTRRLMAEQDLSIDLARKLLSLANTGAPRWIGLNDDLTLHLASVALNCKRAGGDHFWARTAPAARSARGLVTTIGIRDQSGHEVNCILRSIASDLLHMEALDDQNTLEEQIARVNEGLCSCGMFAEDDFLTAMTLELDHATLCLRYVSCGHPPMLLIRGTSILPVPDETGPGRNLPLGALKGQSFEAGELGLKPGDRLLLYTDGLAELGKQSRSRTLSNQEILRLVASVLTEAPGIPVNQLIKRLLQVAAADPDIGSNTAELRDDVTLLGLEIEEDGAGTEAVLHLNGTTDIDHATRQLSHDILSEWKTGPPGPKVRQFLDEAVTNAWLHGNKRNPELPIRVRWGRHNGYALQVEDAGPGFDPSQVLDPRSPEGLTHEQGRGLFIINNACDWVHWKKGGTRLVARLANGSHTPRK